jgi:5'-nucleotidase
MIRASSRFVRGPLRLLPAVLLAAAALLLSAALEAQQAPYRILVTNDDGVRAPGLLAVAQALQALGEVTIVAPLENQSAKSQSLSISDPIYADPVELPGGLKATGLAATPATCVKVALGALMQQSNRPHLVVSGINRGYNLGMTTYISGTVGAAREAALNGVPAIAASLAVTGHPDYGPAAEYVRRIAGMVKAKGLDRGVFMNVNIPAGATDTIKGWRLATQSLQFGLEGYVEHQAPRGRRYFWTTYEDPTGDVEGTDVWAVEHGYVAVTPLRAGEFDRGTADAWKALIK